MRVRTTVVCVVFTACFAIAGEAAAETDESLEAGDRLAQASSDEGAESESDKKKKAQKVLKLLKDGKKAAKAGNYQKAYDLFEEANSIYPRPGLQFRLGQLADRLDQPKTAMGHFKQYLEVSPPEEEASSDTKENLEKAKARIDEIKASLPATIEVASTPSGADIFVGSADGEPVGQTPLSHKIDRQGEVTVIVSKSGYEKSTKTIDAARGETVSVEVSLSQKEMAASPRANGAAKPDGSAPTDGAGGGGAGAFPAIGWGSAGLGVAGVGLGIVFHSLHLQTDSQVTNYNPSVAGNSQAELDDLEDQAAREFDGALIGYSAGGAFLATGATLLVYHYLIRGSGGASEKAAIRPSLRINRRGAVGGLQLSF